MEILLQFGWAPSKSTLCPDYQRTVCIFDIWGRNPPNPPSCPPRFYISGGNPPHPQADTIEFHWVNMNHGNLDFVVYKWKYRNSDFVVYEWKYRNSDFVVYEWKQSNRQNLQRHISKTCYSIFKMLVP